MKVLRCVIEPCGCERTVPMADRDVTARRPGGEDRATGAASKL